MLISHGKIKVFLIWSPSIGPGSFDPDGQMVTKTFGSLDKWSQKFVNKFPKVI